MGAYKIYFKKSVLKDIEKIPNKDLKRIIKKIDTLSEDPRPSGHEKLSDQEKYRIRQGNYRIIYSIQDDKLTVWIIKVGHRRDVYQKLTNR